MELEYVNTRRNIINPFKFMPNYSASCILKKYCCDTPIALAILDISSLIIWKYLIKINFII